MSGPKAPKTYTDKFQAQEHFEVRPIAWVRSVHRERFGTPRQPAASDDERARQVSDNRIELTDGFPEEALQDLAGFDRIWVIGVFHLNQGWRDQVMPPRGPRVRRGLLATRSPHRPNRLSLSCCELWRVERTTLHVGAIDLLDGTPVLDVKPYLPFADAFPSARAGWVDEIDLE